MEIEMQVKQDMLQAMKAREKERAGTLRLLLSELQKAAKEGSGDELAVLRRERKRRLESQRAFSDGGREELAAAEAAEAEVIAGYLPAELPDEELQRLVEQAIAEAGAAGPKDVGRATGLAIKAAAGRADGGRVSALVRQVLGA